MGILLGEWSSIKRVDLCVDEENSYDVMMNNI